MNEEEDVLELLLYCLNNPIRVNTSLGDKVVPRQTKDNTS